MWRKLSVVVLLAATPLAAQDDVGSALVASGWRHKVWAVYPAEKVWADTVLPDEPAAEAIRVSAAKGETEPFVVILRAEAAFREVKVAPAELAGPDGAKLPATSLSVRRVAYLPIDVPSGTRSPNPTLFETRTGLCPDPLVTGDGLAWPERNLQFWVTLTVPRDAVAGEYRGPLPLSWRREAWLPQGLEPPALPLVVTVRDFALPERTPLLNTAHWDPRRIDRSRRTPEAVRALARDFVSHMQAPEPVLPPPKLTVGADGQLAVDAAEWEATAAWLLDDLGASHLFVPVYGMWPENDLLQGVYFLWHFPIVAKQRWLDSFIAGDDGALTPLFRERFSAYLRVIGEIVTRHGWLDRVYLTTMDEPYTYHTAFRDQDTSENNYRVVRDYVALARETVPGLRSFCTADPAEGLTGAIDHWCLRNLDRAPAARERAEQHGEVVTFCDNYRTMVDLPAVGPRTLGWLAWRLGARGWLTYETLGGYDTAWEGPVTVLPHAFAPVYWGLGQMFYPDPTAPADSFGLVPSIRWELMREGAEDYEVLWLLRERSTGRDDPAAREAAELLATAADEVLGAPGERGCQRTAVPHGLRTRAEELIERLGGR